jgi:AraC-like DNA-binding protein
MPFTHGFIASEFHLVHYATRLANRAHAHGDYVLTYLFQGSARTQLGNRILHFHPGEVNLLNPGEVHRDFRSMQEREGLMVGVKKEFFHDLLGEMGRGENKTPCFHSPKVEMESKMRIICESIRTELDGREPGREILLHNMVTELLIHLLRRLDPFALQPEAFVVDRMAARWQVRKAIEYLRDSYTEKFDLTRLAAAAGLSKYYLDRVFKRATGLTLYTYMMMLRVDRAKQLLGSPERPIADIALGLGFYDQSHFTNIFKRFTSATPRAFRASIAKTRV